MKAGVELEGLESLGRKFGALDEKVQASIAGKATNFAMTPVVKHAKGLVQARTGFTRDNLAKRTKRYKQDNKAVTVVGVKKKAATTVNGKPHRPANIEHLLHEGFINALTGEFIPGTHYMPRSVQAKKAEINQRLHTKLDRDINKVVKTQRARK